jgi:hypothetical protein
MREAGFEPGTAAFASGAHLDDCREAEMLEKILKLRYI